MHAAKTSTRKVASCFVLSGFLYAGGVSALTFTNFDTRSMALGGTGVASAHPDKAPFFNPALLSTPSEPGGRPFSVSLHAGVRLVDRDNFIDGVRHYQDNDAQETFDTALSEFNQRVDELNVSTEDFDKLRAATSELLDDIEGLSNRPLRAGGSLGITVARRGRTGVAGYVRTFAVGGGIIDFASADRTLVEGALEFGRSTIELIDFLDPYVEFLRENADPLQASFESGGFDALEQEFRNRLETSELSDHTDALVTLLQNYHETYLASAVDVDDVEMLFRLPDFENELQSAVELEGSLITEYGVAVSRRFGGPALPSVGATLKIIDFDTFDYRELVRNASRDNISYKNHRTRFSDFNVDIGLSGRLTDRFRWGVVARNLIKRDYVTIRGNIIELRPQARLGLAWVNENLSIAADLDLTRNEPLGFDSDKRFLGVGIERRGSRWTLRGGIRHNIVDNSELYSLGTAVRLGRTRIELSAAGAKDTAALALQFDVGL